ncbi:hypothetical protein A2716_04365 [candidate division WWE3 bacterium RIFCSPHIGHO2_01_FULL_40_23]|uniref:histidine kinase n=1 Tax=candidate division WWE3 bacterium RIFCSPLOWO2_01_FULL_41_18 TaxID=1802625 RepID=A0A1F4VDR2_UNCKA|nr:MAG: hypothetical protein A2716_04365 [candidate division WWE3 bacterium RIFCSPHIGHO2_01_FULL_40_23]OGC55108.1 MAG: hypothetical protein A3A78_03975 [candidate division WWE3 bacterium RIFCSPLOWO2_01_FULL_41_18]
MFKSARIKLTLWYLAIIMLITLAFSSFVYIGVDRATRHALEGQRRRFERRFTQLNTPFGFPRGTPMLDAETLAEIRSRTLATLLVINGAVLIISATSGYFLAGRTLKPIEEMVERQKRFISDAAHEIKTPLTSMKTGLEVTLRSESLTVKEAKKALGSAIEEVDKLHKFTGKLLKQSRYQNGNNAKKETVNLQEVLAHVVKKLKPQADKRGEVLVLTGTDLKITGDKDELEELFINLIENSIKYNKANKPVTISLSSEKNYAKVSIEDFGKGIPEEDLPHIFEPFYRADKSRKDSQHEGYGLGLTIAKEIVERHHGEILVVSKKNNGAKFTVKLPLSNFSV